VICSAPQGGTVAVKVEKKGDGFTGTQLWKKSDVVASMYNTPVLKDGLLFGLTAGTGGQGPTRIFCLNAQTGDTLWTDTTQRGECGTILDAGPVLLAVTSDGNLLAFKPSKTGYEEVAKYKVADTPSWSCPIVTGNRVFVKDRDAVTLWTIE
jgi:outer membrane protein assembly factor BamB